MRLPWMACIAALTSSPLDPEKCESDLNDERRLAWGLEVREREPGAADGDHEAVLRPDEPDSRARLYWSRFMEIAFR